MRIAAFGGTGASGRAFLEAAVARGLSARGLCRPAARAALPPGVEVVRGELGDASAVAGTVTGADVVYCGLGPRAPHTDVFCASATRSIVEAMRGAGVARLLCQTGAMIGPDVANWSVPVRLMVRLFRRQRPHVAADRAEQERLVRESGLDWTLVKPPRLTNAPARGQLRVGPDLRIGLLSKLSRADLAGFLISECLEPRHPRQAIYIVG